MPRALGQIDLKKTEAILDAADEVFLERGLGASLEEIARRAGVSKQTVYNRFGSKDDLLRMLVEQRREAITALLDQPDAHERLEETLAGYARTLLALHQRPAHCSMLRLTIAAAAEQPETGRIVFEAGPRAARERMAQFLAAETQAGRLAVDDPQEAAEFFAGMVSGHLTLRGLLGVPRHFSETELDRRARSCARRFIRAYAP
jgi:AcrR family transcriptional regulator